MPKFRYPMNGSWYKGNTHIHSIVSDGGKDFNELAQLYAGAGYHFLFRTDHWIASDVGSDSQAYPLLWLDGIELDGFDHTGAEFHVVALGSFEDFGREMGLEKAMESARAQNGLLIMAHPRWMGNTFEDAARWHFDGIEVYNHICQWLNGKGDGGAYWNAVLNRYPGTLALAVDDAHLKPDEPGCNGGWVVVNAPECTREAILAALRSGNFYASRGPAFHSIRLQEDKIAVECSPAQYVRLVGPGYRGQRVAAPEGQPLTQAVFKVPQDWAYMSLVIEDAQGFLAWSNTLFIPEEKS